MSSSTLHQIIRENSPSVSLTSSTAPALLRQAMASTPASTTTSPSFSLSPSSVVSVTASTPISTSAPIISPFLLLPTELRNEIYIILLTSPHIPALRQISSRGHVSDYILPSVRLTPTLLSTCRQIHAEALPILYGANTFAAHSSLLASLPYLISPRRPVLRGPGMSRIRKWYINVRLDVDPRFSAEGAKVAFSGAEELQIDVFQAMYGSCDFSVLRLFEGVRGVSKAVVTGSTASRAYAKWLEKVMMLPEGQEMAAFVDNGDWDAWANGNR